MLRVATKIVLLIVVAAMFGWPSDQAGARSYLRWAYYVPDDPRSYQSLRARHAYLDIIAPDAWRIHSDGSVTSRLQPDVVAQMRAWGLKVVPMVAKRSWHDKMHGLLSSPEARSKLARTLSTLVIEGGYDGIHIAIENVARQDGPALEALVAEVANGVRGNGRLVTMALPARTTRLDSFPAFDYGRLGAHLDLVIVMAYDHGYSGGRPSPVAPLPWVADVVAYATERIPRSKVLLGIPWYGYDWNTTTRAPGRYVGFAEALSRGGQHVYDQQAQAPGLRYVANGQHHQIWYEDARSVRHKLDLVVRHGLGGWGAWRLGYDDPAIWSLIRPRR
jgi:spore germination protein